jgi:hypothetical protein
LAAILGGRARVTRERGRGETTVVSTMWRMDAVSVGAGLGEWVCRFPPPGLHPRSRSLIARRHRHTSGEGEGETRQASLIEVCDLLLLLPWFCICLRVRCSPSPADLVSSSI